MTPKSVSTLSQLLDEAQIKPNSASEEIATAPLEAPKQTTTPDNTQKAYAADWRHFTRWCRREGVSPLPASPALVARYLNALKSPSLGPKALKPVSVERRLFGLCWNFEKRGQPLDRSTPEISTLLAALRARPKDHTGRKEALQPSEIAAMVATLPFDLRGLRDRALLLLGYTADLGRTQLVGLDLPRSDLSEPKGWIALTDHGVHISVATRSGRREVEIARDAETGTCPVYALEQWLHFSKIKNGPVFVRTSRDGKRALSTRLNDKHVARLIKRTVLAAGLRPDMPEQERLKLFSGHSLRSGRAQSAKQRSELAEPPSNKAVSKD